LKLKRFAHPIAPSQRGVTLIELLIAIALTSGIILLATQVLRRSGMELSLRGKSSKALMDAVSMKHEAQRQLAANPVLCADPESMEFRRYRDSVLAEFQTNHPDIQTMVWTCESGHSSFSSKPEVFFQIHVSGKGFGRQVSGIGIK
jgi:prepilin-type N-terminal cleavage/methylation domain-containing protein